MLSKTGDHVTYRGSEVLGVSESDQKNFSEFSKRMTKFSDLLNKYLNKPPPRLGTKNKKDLFTLAMLGFDLRKIGKIEMREFLRLIGMNIFDAATSFSKLVSYFQKIFKKGHQKS